MIFCRRFWKGASKEEKGVSSLSEVEKGVEEMVIAIVLRAVLISSGEPRIPLFAVISNVFAILCRSSILRGLSPFLDLSALTARTKAVGIAPWLEMAPL